MPPAEPEVRTSPRARSVLVRSTQGVPLGVASAELRALTRDDVPALAAVCHAAYLGTIDDQGENADDWLLEAAVTLGGAYGPVVWQGSWLALCAGEPRAVTVVTQDPQLGTLLAYCATHPAAQRQGLAAKLLRQSLGALAALGHPRLTLVVTDGNVAARALYDRLGFVPREDLPPPRRANVLP